MRDMRATSDVLDFGSRDELRAELVKRVTMTQVMRHTQARFGGRRSFGYPFTAPSLFWGPRVGYAARDYWLPATPDNYGLRQDPARRAQIRSLPRRQRHTVYGDQPTGYSFSLSPQGVADPYEAIVTLFSRQPSHRRTLVHCDYLVSLVHFRALMAAMGKPAFNARIASYGAGRVRLDWDLFADLEPVVRRRGQPPRTGLGSIRQVVPASREDLVIGDHVYFFNHAAYDLINMRVGNAWRLENAVLIARQRGTDVFLGHGSGQKTAAQMKAKLAQEYNQVARMAIRTVARTRTGSPAQRAAAASELATRFPSVVRVGSAWRIRGTNSGLGVAVDQPLAPLPASAIPGLADPANPSRLYPVRRPVESA